MKISNIKILVSPSDIKVYNEDGEMSREDALFLLKQILRSNPSGEVSLLLSSAIDRLSKSSESKAVTFRANDMSYTVDPDAWENMPPEILIKERDDFAMWLGLNMTGMNRPAADAGWRIVSNMAETIEKRGETFAK